MSLYKKRLKRIIYGTDTKSGIVFDVLLILTILLSVLLVMLDSVNEYHISNPTFFKNSEWVFTILFTLEYAVRIYVIRFPSSYIFSFFGIIDLLALIPTYLSMIIPGAGIFSVIRILRVLRVFRVLKLVQYMGEADLLMKAMIASKRKIFVYLFFLMTLVIILGSIMYLVEGEQAGFDSIPRSIYWAIVTLTTVGYGDISPMTTLGQLIASVIMIMGYSIIAVPTGIVTSAIHFTTDPKTKPCMVCEKKTKNLEAKFCSNCGAEMSEG